MSEQNKFPGLKAFLDACSTGPYQQIKEQLEAFHGGIDYEMRDLVQDAFARFYGNIIEGEVVRSEVIQPKQLEEGRNV